MKKEKDVVLEKDELKNEGMPGFKDTLVEMLRLHISKNIDYANENKFYNFDVTESIIKHFNNPRDIAFVWPIANKLARLAVLLNKTDPPNNESIEDSLEDIAVYTVMWKCDIARRG
jgi:hypothetical protein